MVVIDLADYNAELLPERVNEFINYMIAVKGCSKLTVNSYVRDLRLLLEFIVNSQKAVPSSKAHNQNEEIDLSFIDDEFLSKIKITDIYAFFNYCATERSNSIITRNRKASSIRSFFKYISDNMNYISENPVSKLQIASGKKKLPKYLSLEESQALLDSVEGNNSLRDYCILTLFLNCGLRLAELVGLNLSDVDLERRTMKVFGKGSKERMLYLNDACVDSIKAYLTVRPVDGLKGTDRDALFISRLNKRMGRQAVQLMVYHYLEKIGLDGRHYSVHKLRHTAATLLYQHNGVDVMVLKEMLGHENLATTEIYTHVENKQVRQAIENGPLSKKSRSKN